MLLEQIKKRITKLCDEVYCEDEVIDSDGLDQAEREGLEQALVIVEDEFRKIGIAI